MRYRTLVVMVSLATGCGIFGSDTLDPPKAVDESHLEKEDGDSQVVARGETVTVQVFLNPANANSPFRGYPVNWEVMSGGGSVASASTLTDDNGTATVHWTLGESAVQRLKATTDIPGGDSTVTFTAFAKRLAVAGGDRQTVRMGQPLAPLVIAYRDVDGSPLAGERIRWIGDNGLSVGSPTVVDANGLAQMTPVISRPESLQPTNIVAEVVGREGDRIAFSLLSPYVVEIVSGDSQSADRGVRLPQPLAVRWVDSATGAAGPPSTFVWEVKQGGGVLDVDTTRWTASSSTMSNGWVLGPTLGRQVVQVRRLDGVRTHLDITANAASTAQASGCGGTGVLHEGNGTYNASGETWTAAASPHIVRGLVRFDVYATLTIEAGAIVCLEPDAGIYVARDLQAIGTVANPIRFLAADTSFSWGSITLGGNAGPVMSQISNARFEHGYTAINSAAPVRIDSTIIRQSRNIAIAIQNDATTNQVYHTTVDTTRGANPAVLLNAPGTHFVGTVRGASSIALMVNANDVRLEGCDISGNNSFGVLVAGFSGAVITGCNLTGNTGFAVAASAGSPVDARSNWWGSAAGPPPSGANSASAGVDATSPLAAPASIGYRPVW